jgi:hypothetical protein
MPGAAGATAGSEPRPTAAPPLPDSHTGEYAEIARLAKPAAHREMDTSPVTGPDETGPRQ